jgi:hypothetical protein
MTRLIVGLLCFLFASGACATNWLSPPPATSQKNSVREISATAFFEVAVSKFDTAEDRLKSKAFVLLTDNDASYYGHPEFQCAAPSGLYLVRAAYDNGGTGQFSLYWQGTDLVVSHMSLGPAGDPRRSALVACLSKAPGAVYGSIGGAL